MWTFKGNQSNRRLVSFEVSGRSFQNRFFAMSPARVELTKKQPVETKAAESKIHEATGECWRIISITGIRVKRFMPPRRPDGNASPGRKAEWNLERRPEPGGARHFPEDSAPRASAFL
jgi:hypothetical protein